MVLAAAAGGLSMLAALAGCSRTHYRRQADEEVDRILAAKSGDSRWSAPDYSIAPDPRSRFFDPTDPDNPPMPPDDPAVRPYLEAVYGMRGSKRWQRLGQVDFIENPAWPRFLQAALDGQQEQPTKLANLTLTDAIELSLIHSREYQTQLENLYLTALDLTLERYQFDLRFSGFAGEPGTELFYQHQPDDRSDLQLGPTHFGVSKLLPSGAQLVAELANNTIWLFSGPNRTNTASSFAFSLVQPLLNRAGREIAMENLTQAERNVVYALRNFARFRKQFFVSTITGGQIAGLQRFLRGFEFLAGGGETPSVGFFPLLLRFQQLRNREAQVRRLEYVLRGLQASGASELDLAQVESSLLAIRSEWISDTRQFNDRVDQYKVQLGLPPDVELTLDKSLLEPFRFVDPSMIELEDRLRRFRQRLAKEPHPPDEGELKKAREELDECVRQVARAFKTLEDDFRRLDKVLPERLKAMGAEDRQRLRADMSGDRQRLADARGQFDRLVGRLEPMRRRPGKPPAGAEQRAEMVKAIGKAADALLSLVSTLTTVQVSIRVELIPLAKVSLDAEEAVRLALANRLDLMNQRAMVADARRKLELAADALEATLDAVVEGEVNTPPLDGNSRPFNFRARDSRFRVGLQFTSPLDRRAARNDFRAAQIAYQRARRAYMAAEDRIKLDVRQSVRTLKELAERLELRRRGVRIAARQLEFAQTQSRRGQQGINIVWASYNLLNAQDETIETWLDYESTRLNLFRDMGTMQIDRRGIWLDPFYQQMAAGD